MSPRTTALAIVAASLAGAAIALHAGRLAAASGPEHDSPPRPSSMPPKVLYAPAFASMGDGSAIYTDGTGRLFHLRSGPEGLTLGAVYRIRLDHDRFLTEPGKRSPHGHYVDDLGPETAADLLRAQERFTRESRSGAVDAGANARLEEEARAVVAWGDATFLLGKLEDKTYSARRAAALILGGRGYAEARKVLEEVATETEGDGAERARKLLETLPK